jgi:hypothetical protein
MKLARTPTNVLGAAALTAVVWAGAVNHAQADYKESYRKGMDAVDRGNWPEVARRMREAQAEQSKEGEKLKLYGMRFESYLPSYYLGIALLNGGDCLGALNAFAASESQGAVQKSDQAKLLVKHKATCQAKVGQVKPPDPPPSAKPAGPDPAVALAQRTAEASVSSAEEQSREVAGLSSDPALAARWGQDPGLAAAQKQASDLLQSARAALEAGRRKPDAAQLTEANDLAGRAARQFGLVKQTAEQRREEARRAANDVRPPEALKTTPSSTGPGPSVATPGPTGPPGPLVAAARAYFDGQYREAAAQLSGVSYPGKSGAQAMLFRAAARHALYVLGGEKNGALETEARADVQACRRLSPGFAPDPRFFSPRFTTFFKSTQ